MIDGRAVTPVDAAAQVLRKLKRDAETLHFYKPVSRAVITHPAVFDEIEKDKVREAAARAGFPEVELLAEPVSAALAYAAAGVEVGRHVLATTGEEARSTWLFWFVTRTRAFSGWQWSRRFASGWRRLRPSHLRFLRFANPDQVREAILCPDGRDLQLLRQCRKYKENLSLNEMPVPLSWWLSGMGRLKLQMRRKLFEELIDKHVESTIQTDAPSCGKMRSLLTANGVPHPHRRSSRVPLIQRRLQEAPSGRAATLAETGFGGDVGRRYHAQTLWEEGQPLKEVKCGRHQKTGESKSNSPADLANPEPNSEFQMWDPGRQRRVAAEKRMEVETDKTLEACRPWRKLRGSGGESAEEEKNEHHRCQGCQYLIRTPEKEYKRGTNREAGANRSGRPPRSRIAVPGDSQHGAGVPNPVCRPHLGHCGHGHRSRRTQRHTRRPSRSRWRGKYPIQAWTYGLIGICLGCVCLFLYFPRLSPGLLWPRNCNRGSNSRKDMQTKPLVHVLRRGAETLRAMRLPGELAASLELLAAQVDQPCVLAIVGRMKAGKSTSINALLGEDLACVGTKETTATINYFRYGNPADPARPICCHSRNGRLEDVDRDFLDGLQGNDLDTLRRAAGIDHLGYFIVNPFLRNVTLVDTPGTAAVVDEHQDRIANFLQLHKQLRQRHEQDTQRIGSEADAVIYLVGQVPRATDRDFLDEFNQANGGQSALNALGVMAKIDAIDPDRQAFNMPQSKVKMPLEDEVRVGACIKRSQPLGDCLLVALGQKAGIAVTRVPNHPLAGVGEAITPAPDEGRELSPVAGHLPSGLFHVVPSEVGPCHADPAIKVRPEEVEMSRRVTAGLTLSCTASAGLGFAT